MPEDVRVRDKPVLYRGRWYAVYYEGGTRRRQALGTDDKQIAELALARFRAELNKPKGQTVAHLWQAYEADNAGKAVITTMGYTWRALKGRFGHLQTSDITVEVCRAHTAARRGAGIKNGTIWTELGHLRMVMLWAEKRRLIDRAPYIERPAKPDPKRRHLTKREAVSLIEAATTPHIRLFIVLALATAGRREALLSLTWDRVDFESGLISLRDPDDPTRRKGRATVPMNRMLRKELALAKEGAQTDHVIEWGAAPVRSVKKGLGTAGEKAGLSGISAHILRHTAAVWMRQAGRPIGEIAEYLGHSDEKVTARVYARYGPEHLRDASDALVFGEEE